MIKSQDFRVLIAYPNLSMMLTPSYAVGLFTSILKEQGYEVDLFDCTQYVPKLEFLKEPLPVTRANRLLNSRKFDAKSLYGDPKDDLSGDLAKKLDEYKPHVVVVSTLVEDTWPQAEEMLEVLSGYPEIRTIIGGIFATMAPEAVMADPRIQCIGIGEGEETVVEFCECVRNGTPPTSIEGTWARDENGQVIKNPARPALVDIDRVLPDFSLFDERRFLRPLGARIWKAIPLETFRGCPYTCTFCNSPRQIALAKQANQGYFPRRKGIASLKREIETMIERHNAEFFYVNDDAFLARSNQDMADFVDMYRDFKIPFWLQTRVENINQRKLDWLTEIGCYRISFGLEHGNEKFRREILHRNISNEVIRQRLPLVAEAGIPYTLNNIVGFPYETRELLFDTIRLNRDIGTFDSLSVNIFVPYHGTPLRESAIREGWLDPNRQTTSVISESILEMPAPYLSGSEILSLQRVFPLYVSMHESRYPDIRRAESFDDAGNAAFEALAAEWYEMMYGTDEANRMLTYQG